MSSISTLLTRNLHDVFGENDAARRRAAIDEIFTEDGVFYDPTSGAHRGRDEIDRVAGAIKRLRSELREFGPGEVKVASVDGVVAVMIRTNSIIIVQPGDVDPDLVGPEATVEATAEKAAMRLDSIR